MANQIKAYNTNVKFQTTAVAVITTASLASLFSAGTAIQHLMKSVTITPPEGAADKIDLLGASATYFQNQLLDDKPYGLATLSGTLIVDRDDKVEILMDQGSTSVTSGATTYDRFQFGKLSAGTTIGRPTVAMLVQLKHPYTGTATKECNIVLNNAMVTKVGDYRISGPDGHWEVDINMACLAKDYYIEYLQ